MLTVTDRAATTLFQSLARRGLDDTHGHRIVRLPSENGTSHQFRLEAASAPALQDTVVACDRTYVFIAPDALDALADAVLDVNDKAGGAGLVLRPAGPARRKSRSDNRRLAGR